MTQLSIDIETYSSVDITAAGMYKYVQSPDFEILLVAFSYDNGPVNLIDLTSGEKLPESFLSDMTRADVIKHAYNAAFEWYCFSKYFNLNNRSAQLWLDQWRCTMLHGLYCGYPMGLAAVNSALKIPEDKKKLTTGKALIRLFCTPTKPSKKNGNRTRTLPHHEPEKWALFKEYCKQDVIAEMAVEDKLKAFPVPEQEQKLWLIDQCINLTGVQIDIPMAKSAIAINSQNSQELMSEAINLTGLDNPNSQQQALQWLKNEGLDIEDLTKETVSGALEFVKDPEIKRYLKIRQMLSKTSIKKYEAMLQAAGEDGRARGLLQFYGANRTGRWAGRLIQVHNLPKNSMPLLDTARGWVRENKRHHLSLTFGNVSNVLSQLIRTAFVPEANTTFLVADFSAIEARVIAWLAGEKWRQEVFATHGRIYEASASAMFGVPIDKIKKGNPEYALRQKGKIAELALGYGGSTGALIQMGALKMGLKEDELPDIVSRWRNANKQIIQLWYGMESAATEALKTGRVTSCKGIQFAYEIDLPNQLSFLTMRLPSGRKLYYVNPRLGLNRWERESIYYDGTDQTTKWVALNTYGGKLVENCVQAIARDCLAESVKRLYDQGYKIVFHVHDEIIIEGDKDQLDDICDEMGKPIDWAPGLLLKAEGFTSDYYKKDD